MQKFRRLLPYAYRQWPALLGIAGLTALSSLVTAFQPWPLKILVDHAIASTPATDPLSRWLTRVAPGSQPGTLILIAGAASLLLFVLNSLLDIGLTWGWAVAGQRMVRDIAMDLFHRLQRLSFRYHQQHPTGDSLDRLTSDTWCVYTLTDGLLISPVQKLITLGTLGLIAWQLNRELAVYSLLTAPLMAWATWHFGTPLKRRARVTREARARLVSFVHQTLSSIPVVQTFATESRNWDRFQELAANSVSVSQRAALMTSYYGLVTGLITVAGTAVILYVGGRQVLNGALTVGSFLVFLAYLRNLQGTAEGLLKIYGTLKPVEASVDRVLEILASPDAECSDPPHSPPPPLNLDLARALDPLEIRRSRLGARAGSRESEASDAGATAVPASAGLSSIKHRVRGDIAFHDVTFGYEPDSPVLRNISFAAPAGEVVALVGATGVGKSTLASLLPRFYEPWSGRITLDGMDLREIPLADLRAQIAMVFQDPFLLPLTVAENLAYGRPEATRAEIIAAAQAARADSFIERLPRGYDTVIGERGATLSGGERQRLAIGRAMLRNAPILILDEPTSALDAETEALILEALQDLMRGRTTFIIAHRLSTVRKADQILVLEDGRIVESGTHAELLQHAGAYARYVQLQGRGARLAEVAA